ncbi:flagellar protein FliT [Nitrosomonas sp.]|uniref:flagellar protein FliT n=1 Tax=Nitrosomonas sp. TaxID=42353 RepID=UPI0025E486E9|nr:flagellar protein FliT [Nitrosomonas sp.]MBE7527769.1 flagellar protein FliT [Burkholderiales bacterium]
MKQDIPIENLPKNNRNDMQMIATYEAILTITDQMLQAAKNSDWDELIALEQNCKHLTTHLMAQHASGQLDDELRQKKINLIHGILERDAEIRAITEPWMVKLQNQLTGYDRNRKLGQTYQTDL